MIFLIRSADGGASRPASANSCFTLPQASLFAIAALEMRLLRSTIALRMSSAFLRSIRRLMLARVIS
jgi:hypothetical protein